ncbi:MAG TPA: pirin family protein [Kofleriaceae bacterium]|nr:pirin family protein [Kofleriaceae bacterium]
MSLLIVEGKARPVGTVTVARVLPSMRRRAVGPFVFVDHMGPLLLEPGVGFDVRPHPHIGLSTVTYFYEGENVHRDSLGSVRTNVPGDVNLMTAGRGVVHSERADPGFRARGGRMHGVQIWLGLPLAHEDDEPSFEHHPAATLPRIEGDKLRGRVLLGDAFGARSPIVHPSRPVLVDLELDGGAAITIPHEAERGVLVIEGSIAIGDDVLEPDHLAVIDADARVEAHGPARVLVLGGPRLDGERHLEWNFVSSSKDKLAAARERWKAREFPTIPGDDVEWIPYPSAEVHS